MAQAQGSGKMIVLADQREGTRTSDLAGYRLEVSPGGTPSIQRIRLYRYD